MFQRWLFWPLFAALMGFAVGGSFVWAIDHPNDQQHISRSDSAADTKADQNQPAKTFGKALSVIWDRTWDDPVAFYTFILAIFTALLAGVASVQIFFLIRADKTARISAEAAQSAAKAFQITERPYIFIWGVQGHHPKVIFNSSTDPTVQKIVDEHADFIYNASNRGKLAAVIERVSIACGYQKFGRYPPLVIMGDHWLIQSPILSADQDQKNLRHRVEWNMLDWENRTPGFREGLIFQVVIYYRGPFTRGHQTSQSWRYDASLKAFAEISDQRYTYSS